MLFRSERSNTVLESLQLPTGHAPSLNDLLKLLNAAGVKRVQLNSASVYRKRLVSDDGSQFTVFEDDGVKRYGQPIGIVKSTKFKINEQGQIDDDHSKVRCNCTNPPPKLTNRQQRSASWLYRELRVLTDPLLSKHENIIKLLYYDLVQESAGIVRPALLMERASFGSLDHFLESQSEPISHQDRTLLCEDLTHALLALHTCGIAHGDVKAANALVFGVDCPTAPEGEGEVSQQRRFIAKLADFGSSILLEMGPGSMTYYGTPVTNAPEVERQSSEHPFRAEDVLKCDAYSLGLLYLNVLTGRLDDCLITKNDSVLTYALAQVRGLGLEQEAETFMLGALTKLLPYNPHDRISDLSLILR
jgi:serine/threonine protein kinase